jgi:hypothetical protein
VQLLLLDSSPLVVASDISCKDVAAHPHFECVFRAGPGDLPALWHVSVLLQATPLGWRSKQLSSLRDCQADVRGPMLLLTAWWLLVRVLLLASAAAASALQST